MGHHRIRFLILEIFYMKLSLNVGLFEAVPHLGLAAHADGLLFWENFYFHFLLCEICRPQNKRTRAADLRCDFDNQWRCFDQYLGAEIIEYRLEIL